MIHCNYSLVLNHRSGRAAHPTSSCLRRNWNTAAAWPSVRFGHLIISLKTPQMLFLLRLNCRPLKVHSNYKYRDKRSQNITYPPLSQGGFDGSASSWPWSGRRGKKINMRLVSRITRKSICIVFCRKGNRPHCMQANAYRNSFKHLQWPRCQGKSYRHRQCNFIEQLGLEPEEPVQCNSSFKRQSWKQSFYFFPASYWRTPVTTGHHLTWMWT